jgi:hypothetical protein
MISRSLGKLERARLNWWRWFETNGIEPLVVYSEDVIADGPKAVRHIAAALDVANGAGDQIVLPPFDVRADAGAEQWAAQFSREIACGIDIGQSDPGHVPGGAPISDFMQLFPHDATEEQDAVFVNAESAPKDVRSLLPRYDQIIGGNRELLRNATVLDLMSGRGMCSLAALDAGAGYVTGVDPRAHEVAIAARAFAERGIPESSYQFVTMGIMPALNAIDPETFNVIIARGVLERVDLRRFFPQLRRLRPNHVILDTEVAPGQGPLVRFGLRGTSGRATDRSAKIITLPNRDLIALLCDNFGFRLRLADASGAAESRTTRPDRAGAQTWTYILDRIG